MRFATSFAAIAFLVIGVCMASPSGGAMSAWAGLATAHFAIFTPQQNGGGAELLERLERARLFFEKTGWASRDLNRPLSIMAFGSEKDFDAYRPNPGVFAFYQHTREGDFVLMRSLEPEHYSVVVHEYTHFIVEHSSLKLPLWLNEGVADFYSTLESRQEQVVVGLAPPGREDTLRSHAWIDWQTLTSVDHESPFYRQQDKMLLFYAQSWAFVHLLASDPAYADKFRGFLTTMSGAPPTAGDPWSATYHKTLIDLGSETEQCVKAKHVESHLVALDIRPGALQSAEVADSSKQTEFALADVQAVNPNGFEEARVRLEMLAAKYPDDPRAEESLGFLAMRAGRKSDAEPHFVRAVKCHSQDPEVFFSLAHLMLARGGSSDEAIDLLQRAIAGNPGYYNALLELGFAAAKSQKFDLAVDSLEKIATPKPEHAFGVSYTLAYCLSELHRNGKARTNAELSLKIASNPRDKQQASELLAYIKHESKDEEVNN
jgi:Flp pilus assembly protein TadD